MFWIILILVGLLVAAYFVTDDKYGVTSPALVVKQTFHWISFGILTFKDAALLTKDAVVDANVTAELSLKESGAQVDLGLKQGVKCYKESDVRRTLVGARKELRDNTAAKRAKIAALIDNTIKEDVAVIKGEQ